MNEKYHQSIHLIDLIKLNELNDLNISSKRNELNIKFSLFFKDNKKININSEQLIILINLTKYLFKKDKLNILMLILELENILLKKFPNEFIFNNKLWLEINNLFNSSKILTNKLKLNYELLKLKLKYFEKKNLNEIIFKIKKLLKNKTLKINNKEKNNIIKYLNTFQIEKKIIKKIDWIEFQLFIKNLNPIYNFFNNKIIKENILKNELIYIFNNLIKYNFRITKFIFSLRIKLLNKQIILDELIIFLYFISGDYFNVMHYINKIINWYENKGDIKSIYKCFLWQILIENYAKKSFICINKEILKFGKIINIFNIENIKENNILNFYNLKEKEINEIIFNKKIELLNIENIFFNTIFRQIFYNKPLNENFFIHLSPFIFKKISINNFKIKINNFLLKYNKCIYFIIKINDSKIKFINLLTNEFFIIKSKLNDSITRFFSLLTKNRINPENWIQEKWKINQEIIKFLNSWFFEINYKELNLNNSIFLLHNDIYNVPIENFNIFSGKKIKRLNSLEFLIDKIDKINDLIIKPNLKDILIIIDNSEDLINTHIRIKEFLLKYNLPFYYSINEISKEIVINSKSLIYFGHGNGKLNNKNLLNFKFHDNKFLNMNNIFLFGCSSLKINYIQNFQHNFIINEYINIFPNLKQVVGCLWDVTDRDIDLLSLKIIEDFINGLSILDNLENNKQIMRMKGLNGASVVVFGF